MLTLRTLQMLVWPHRLQIRGEHRAPETKMPSEGHRPGSEGWWSRWVLMSVWGSHQWCHRSWYSQVWPRKQTRVFVSDTKAPDWIQDKRKQLILFSLQVLRTVSPSPIMLINCTKLSETLLNHVAPPKLSYPVCIIRPAMKLRRKGQSSSLWGMRWRQGRRFKKDGTVQIRRRKSCSLAAKQWEINLRQQEREEGNNGRDESREEQIKKMMLCDKRQHEEEIWHCRLTIFTSSLRCHIN